VPRRKESKSEAGYDQAERLAKALSKQKGVACVELLCRAAHADLAQKEKGRETRLESASTAYLPAKKIDLVKGKRIVLVDDVMTSGASLNACAEILNQYGAEYVFTLTLGSVARKKDRS
jgi:predicted amidophosphoribosyltransferase